MIGIGIRTTSGFNSAIQIRHTVLGESAAIFVLRPHAVMSAGIHGLCPLLFIVYFLTIKQCLHYDTYTPYRCTAYIQYTCIIGLLILHRVQEKSDIFCFFNITSQLQARFSYNFQ